MTTMTIDFERLTLDEARELHGPWSVTSLATPRSAAPRCTTSCPRRWTGGIASRSQPRRSGIDLATATEADGWRLSEFYGARLGEH